MPRGNIFPDDLPDLKRSQLIDQPGPEDEADEKGGQNRTDRPKRDISKNVQEREYVMKRIEKMIEHLLSPLS
jgi:hypothetical protein